MTTARDTNKHVMETANGRFVDLSDPQPETISIEDIAWALSMTCRFGGHVARFYSVAEHAVLVALLLRDRGEHGSTVVLHGLHHDDHEAFLCDIPTPLKNLMGDAYDDIKVPLDLAIAESLGLRADWFDYPSVKWADATALRLEAHMLKACGGNHPHWSGAWQRYDLQEVPSALVPDEFKGREPWSPDEAFRNFIRLDRKLRR